MVSFGVPNFYCNVLQFNLFTTATLGRINVWTVPPTPPPQKSGPCTLLPPPPKKSGPCGEVPVCGGSPVVEKSKISAEQC